MGFFDDEKNCDSYEEMVAGYDGAALLRLFGQQVPAGSSVLELGMGPGKDLERLAERYVVTGSDASAVFVERWQARGTDVEALQLDAVTLETERKFDAIFSNKVLQHLTRQQCAQSLARQVELLNPGGALFHTLWSGEGEENHHGLLFTYYTPETLQEVLPARLAVKMVHPYKEDKEDDSFAVLLKSGDDV